jgi:hypothetical protein
MICLRCGYCCHHYDVMIIDDPEIGYSEDLAEAQKNIKYKPGGQRCQHLIGDKAGKYSCAIHDKPWYKETPCFQFTQVEESPDAPCRVGEYMLASGLVAWANGKININISIKEKKDDT